MGCPYCGADTDFDQESPCVSVELYECGTRYDSMVGNGYEQSEECERRKMEGEMNKIKWYPIPCTRCGKEAGEVSNRFTGQITQALCPECVARSLDETTELTRLREVEKWAREAAQFFNMAVFIRQEENEVAQRAISEAKTLGLLEDK